MISMDKKYRTMDGRKVKLYSVEPAGDWPIHGAIKKKTAEEWVAASWSKEGIMLHNGMPSNNDLVEIPQEREGQIND